MKRGRDALTRGPWAELDAAEQLVESLAGLAISHCSEQMLVDLRRWCGQPVEFCFDLLGCRKIVRDLNTELGGERQQSFGDGVERRFQPLAVGYKVFLVKEVELSGTGSVPGMAFDSAVDRDYRLVELA